MKKIWLFPNILVLLTLLAACAAPGGGGEQALVQSEKPRNTQPNASAADLQTLAANNRAFAFHLYRQVNQADGNLFFSPHSISVALAMTYAGANGETAQQMRQTLGWSLPDSALHPAFNALQQALAKREKTKDKDEDAAFRLNVVNALWGQKGYTFLPGYLDLLAQNYGAGMRLLDYKADPEAARQVINAWVAGQTADKIKDLIAPGVLNPTTTLVLTNAIYFKAQWLYQFNPDLTQPGPFTLLDGNTVTVPMMRISQRFGYYRGSDFTALELPYRGGEVSMVVILPDAGQYSSVEQGLSAAQWDAALAGMKTTQVNLVMPRFNFSSDLALSAVLKRSGMPLAFQPDQADFSGMDGSKNLFIAEVLHKAYINLDELGTEAAAATAVVVGVTSMPAEPVNISLDRPFVFAVHDQPTGEILFLGRMVDPSTR